MRRLHLLAAAPLVWVLAIVATLPATGTAHAAEINIEYGQPKNPAHKPLHDTLQSGRWLERMRTVMSAFRIPRTLTIKLAGCDGEVDAWFESGTIGVCYEYLHVIQRRADANDLPKWVNREEAMAGAFVDAFMHEFGHALIAYHSIPVLGREEDAADQFSAITMLRWGGEDASSLIRGTATVYLSWIKYYQGRRSMWGERRLASGATQREARQHSSAAQRLYNLVCLAYGADKTRYAQLAKDVELPGSRAEDCPDEYAQVSRAWRQLIVPLQDRKRLDAAQRALAELSAIR